MSTDSLIEALGEVRTGMTKASYEAIIGTDRLPVLEYDDSVKDDPIPLHDYADLGIAVIFSRDQRTVDSVEYGERFTGSVRGITIGITGQEVERRLGPCDRTWPMPHPNYVLIYDRPEFFRVDLSRANERVITMYR